MKKSIIIIIVLAFIVQACAGVKSETLIGPNKTFVLGEGKHPAYSARVKNIGDVNIEIFTQALDGDKVSTGILKANQEETYEVPRNTAVFFQNGSSNKMVRIKVSIKGTSNLSMGYKGN